MKIFLLTFAILCALALQNNLAFAMKEELDTPTLSYKEELHLQKSLLKFIMRGDPVPKIEKIQVELFIQMGAQVNVPWYEHNPEKIPLFVAISRCRIGAVQALLDNGAHPNHEAHIEFNKHSRRYNILKTTPLHYAAQVGCVQIVKMLLEKGAELNKKDGANLTPLSIAANFKNIDVIECILEHHYRTNPDDTFHRINQADLNNLEKLVEYSLLGCPGPRQTHGCYDEQINSRSHALIDMVKKLNLPALLRYLKEQQ